MNDSNQEIIDKFSELNSWEERYEYLIKSGKSLPNLPNNLKTEINKIQGCSSRVWLVCEFKNGLMELQIDSDSLVVKGLAFLLLKLYNHKTPEEVLKIQPEFMQKADLSQHLSPTRNNGFLAILKQIKTLAVAYQSLNASN